MLVDAPNLIGSQLDESYKVQFEFFGQSMLRKIFMLRKQRIGKLGKKESSEFFKLFQGRNMLDMVEYDRTKSVCLVQSGIVHNLVVLVW